eukprot:358354-Chlamydomonas_euryale.AAC.2
MTYPCTDEPLPFMLSPTRTPPVRPGHAPHMLRPVTWNTLRPRVIADSCAAPMCPTWAVVMMNEKKLRHSLAAMGRASPSTLHVERRSEPKVQSRIHSCRDCTQLGSACRYGIVKRGGRGGKPRVALAEP